jgi:hypothetical protein
MRGGEHARRRSEAHFQKQQLQGTDLYFSDTAKGTHRVG